MKNIPDEYRQRGYKPGYNQWHWKKLPRYCYMIDLDSIEIRNKQPKTIIELRSTPTPLNDWQKEIVLNISKKLEIPSYLVYHNNDLTVFDITDLNTDERKKLTEDEYIDFLKGVSKNKSYLDQNKNLKS